MRGTLANDRIDFNSAASTEISTPGHMNLGWFYEGGEADAAIKAITRTYITRALKAMPSHVRARAENTLRWYGEID